MSESDYIMIPRDGVSNDVVEVIEWLAKNNSKVQRGAPVVEVESSKSVTTLTAHRDGFLLQLAEPGARLEVGDPVALISNEQQVGRQREIPPEEGALISKKAARLMEKEGLTHEDFPNLRAIRERDVLRFLGEPPAAERKERSFAGEALDDQLGEELPVEDGHYRDFRAMTTRMRQRLKARFNRHVPTGTLLYDRWDLARDYEFGEGTSVYDECLILGDVEVGRHCWIGPFTVLDGAWAPLHIEDYTQIGSGAQLYTHNTIEHTLTGGLAKTFGRATHIGRCCFISPLSVIGPGTTIGAHSFVATASYVQGEFPPYSYISGSPARIVGKVEVEGGRARLRLDDQDQE